MYIEQLYTNCLAQAAYYIVSNGEAAIIDPLRDSNIYIEKAAERGDRIKYIFETHFHADFVSGHIDLSKKTSAKIIFGPEANTGFDAVIAKDNQEFQLGNITIKTLHTPGHTPESTCYLLIDENGKAHAIFTGDTVFVGDVGRPDLLDGVMSKEKLATMMYYSIQKLKNLDDGLILYPGHGPGSSCGKNIGKETYSTLGAQKKNNYAFLIDNKKEFVKTITSGLTAAPAYFFSDVQMNKNGYISLDEINEKAHTKLTPTVFERKIQDKITIIDSRKGIDFEKGFIKSSVNIGLDGQFAIWAATIFDVHEPVMLVCEKGTEEESITRLIRTGFDNIIGYLEGGVDAWKSYKNQLETITSVEPSQMAEIYNSKNNEIMDVRKCSEYNELHVKDVIYKTLQDLPTNYKIDDSKEYYIYCAGGYRSMIAASYLKSKGYDNVKNVYGGFNKIKKDIPDLPYESELNNSKIWSIFKPIISKLSSFF